MVNHKHDTADNFTYILDFCEFCQSRFPCGGGLTKLPTKKPLDHAVSNWASRKTRRFQDGSLSCFYFKKKA